MKPILFLDRDGVLIREPEGSLQVDSLDKLEFMPKLFSGLGKICRDTEFLLVMVSNQDGLGTESFPEESFRAPQDLLIKTLAGEGIVFDSICIDPSLPSDNSPGRKPGTAMLAGYLGGAYDLSRSLVIGDRITDLQLAANIGCRAVWFRDGNLPGSLEGDLDRERTKELGGSTATDYPGGGDLSAVCALVTDDWEEIARFITGDGYPLPKRTAAVRRATKETDIDISLNLDGTGKGTISTGLRFFDHMLEQVTRHSLCDLDIRVQGDLDIDEHHTIEDTALALGQAFLTALGEKLGISRYGYMLPMDDSLARAAIDFSGRPWLVWDVEFTRDRVGDVPTEMFYHFFKSFSDEARCNLNLSAEGTNSHHIAEGLFKAFARAIRGAVKRDRYNMTLPSTKGVL